MAYHYSSKSERKREPYPFEILGAMERQRSRAVIEVGKLLKNVEQMKKMASLFLEGSKDEQHFKQLATETQVAIEAKMRGIQQLEQQIREYAKEHDNRFELEPVLVQKAFKLDAYSEIFEEFFK